MVKRRLFLNSRVRCLGFDSLEVILQEVTCTPQHNAAIVTAPIFLGIEASRPGFVLESVNLLCDPVFILSC